MHSTGIEALDSRLGGIRRGGFLVVTGEDGVGKSVLGAHFLGAGLDRGERCLLVTADPPGVLDARGLFIGFSPGPLSRHAALRVLDPATALAGLGAGQHRDPFLDALRDGASRVVIDDVNALLRQSRSPASTARALVDLLAEAGATGYVIASTADDVALEEPVLRVFTDAAIAVVGLGQAGRGRRRLTFADVRQPSFSTEPFLYTLRSGGGFAEDLPAYDREVDASLRRRIVILDEVDALPAEVVAALKAEFEVETFTDLNGSLGQLLEARYGVLILGTDPYDPERTFNLAYSLRKAGNGAPILFISRSKGLRSMTRARALRIGGDDFLIAELPPQEIVERITITAERGHHRRNGSVRPDRLLQPRDADGEPRPMNGEELATAVKALVAEAPTPFFALAVLEPADRSRHDELWRALARHVRLADGDLLSILPDGRVALVLNQVDLALAERVIARLRRTHAALSGVAPAAILTSPLQAEELRGWVSELRVVRAES